MDVHRVSDPVTKILGSLIREERERRGLTQEGLAALAGLHRTFVGEVERGESSPTIWVLARLCGALDMRLSHLFAIYEQSDEPTKPKP